MVRHVVSVNEFSAMCNCQVVQVQVEQNRRKNKALRKAVTLESPRTGVTAHVHPETSISKQQTHQSGEPIWHAFTQFVIKKTSVPDSVICCSSNEPGELSQWLCHDDSTINIVVVIIIIIITVVRTVVA